jgi:hypothetical protein
LVILACILAGCGGGEKANWQQIHGANFTFEAPAGWTVAGTAASSGPVDRVQVNVFRLVHPFKHGEQAAVARELDSVAGRLAQQLKGRVVSRRTVAVAGNDAREYLINHGSRTEEITFVLQGRREYQLLCRRAKGADDAACRKLVASFRPG